jgi:hypothetical protein
MANLNVTVETTDGINVEIDSGTQQSVSVNTGANLTVQVTPVAQQSIVINRGLIGPPGPNTIGGYGFDIQNLQAQDVLMFGGAAWENTPQTEITDGGNF